MKKTDQIQIASRYVSALFDVAKATSALDAVEKDLQFLATEAMRSVEFSDFLRSPLLNRPQAAAIIAALADGIKAHKLTRAFLVALAEGKRLEALAESARQFSQKAEAERGELSAELITAAPISAADAQEVALHLGKAYGKKIRLHTTQDKNLLGGIVVKIAGQQLDSSIAGKLERMNLALKAA